MGSVRAVVTLAGYPSRNTLYRWYEDKLAGTANYHGSPNKQYNIKQKYLNTVDHLRYPDTNLKLNAIYCCFSLGEVVEYVLKDIGYSRTSIYN